MRGARHATLVGKSELPATATPPDEIYTHTVWLCQHVHETAGKIVSGYDSVLQGLTGLLGKSG